MKKKIPLILIGTFLLTSCSNKKNEFDASGAFEAEETIISAEATGTIKEFKIEEGQLLPAGQQIGYVDSTPLFLKKRQVQEQIKAVLSRRPDIPAQVGAIEEQLKTFEKEIKRVSSLVKAEAAPQKQLDDINAQIEVLKKQREAQQSALGITSQSINLETSPLEIQIEQINDQLEKCKIINPLSGTVLTKYVQEKEMSIPGKPLYKIADLTSLFLRAYITGNQLSQFKVDQKVKVLVDDGSKTYKEIEGVITWVSGKAEFTPKTIQTKDERANLVYAIKIKVTNDGSLKIGMYGGVVF